MIRERGEPAIADTSKPIIEPPVFPDYPENTQKTRPVAEDPDLIGDDEEEDEDFIEEDDKVVDEFASEDIDDRNIVIEDGDDILNLDDEDDDY